MVAAADSTATIADPKGLDVAALSAHKRRSRPLKDFRGAKVAAPDAVIDADCDIWIPAARPDVIRADNVGRLKARLMLQGANIPVTPDAEAALHARGVLCVPDFIATAGGVICAAVEYPGGTQAVAFARTPPPPRS